MSERIEVYETLRSEIIYIMGMQRNIWINMYVLFCTLFVLGLQWSHYFFLVTYIILIPFQCVINDYWQALCRIATYIRVFFENEDTGISWESFQKYKPYTDYYKTKRKGIISTIGKAGAIYLGILATTFYCGYAIKDSWVDNRLVLRIEEALLILLSLALCIILIIIKKNYYRTYDTELENIMEQYKQERMKNKE